MTDRPIIFSAPMVRALIEGRKTQTRRVLKVPAWATEIDEIGDDGYTLWCVSRESGCIAPGLPQYLPGDRLYVREAFAMNPAVRRPDRTKNVIYRADAPAKEPPAGNCLTMDVLLWSEAKELKWNPSIHMPRWASRITLIITDVRVQRLQDISESDAWAEGCKPGALNDRGEPFPAEEPHPKGGSIGWDCAVDWYADLWNSLHGPDAWDANPWVVAVSFTVEQRNIDAGGGQ